MNAKTIHGGRGWHRTGTAAAAGLMALALVFGLMPGNAEAQTRVLQERVASIDFYGFHTGMTKAEAEALAESYGLDTESFDFFIENSATHEVFSINFGLEQVQQITKGPDTFLELLPIVAKAIGAPNRPWDELTSLSTYTCQTPDGVLLKMTSYNEFSIFDSPRAAARPTIGCLPTVSDNTYGTSEQRDLIGAMQEGLGRCAIEVDED